MKREKDFLAPIASNFPLPFVLALTLSLIACARQEESAPPPPESPTVKYRALEKFEGGAIAGRVRFTGIPPNIPPRPITKHREACGSEPKPQQKLLLAADGGVRNAVIWLADIMLGAKLELPESRPALDQVKCEFVPHLQIVPLGSTLEIVNSDPIPHNVHAYIGQETVFNLVQLVQGQITPRRLDRHGIMRLKCDVGHTWMEAYIVVAEHPYYAATDRSGYFRLERVPAGTYRLKLWHEYLGVREKEVAVESGKETFVSFEFHGASSLEQGPVNEQRAR